MSRIIVVALSSALFLSACATSGDVVSSRNYLSPVFVPDLSGGAGPR